MVQISCPVGCLEHLVGQSEIKEAGVSGSLATQPKKEKLPSPDSSENSQPCSSIHFRARANKLKCDLQFSRGWKLVPGKNNWRVRVSCAKEMQSSAGCQGKKNHYCSLLKSTEKTLFNLLPSHLPTDKNAKMDEVFKLAKTQHKNWNLLFLYSRESMGVKIDTANKGYGWQKYFTPQNSFREKDMGKEMFRWKMLSWCISLGVKLCFILYCMQQNKHLEGLMHANLFPFGMNGPSSCTTRFASLSLQPTNMRLSSRLL